MSIAEFLAGQPVERQDLLNKIHAIILKEDKSVKGEVGPMMGKEMILYKCNGNFKYALANTQKHMSLHLMPIYVSPDLHTKYKALLNKASFQKGCVNFKNESEMPAQTVEALMRDSSKIDLVAIREAYLKGKK